MKTVELGNLPQQVSKLLEASPHERVLLTRGGKPFAILSDATFLDEEDIGYISDPAFWATIAERRNRGGVSLVEAYRRLEQREANQSHKKQT